MIRIGVLAREVHEQEQIGKLAKSTAPKGMMTSISSTPLTSGFIPVDLGNAQEEVCRLFKDHEGMSRMLK